MRRAMVLTMRNLSAWPLTAPTSAAAAASLSLTPTTAGGACSIASLSLCSSNGQLLAHSQTHSCHKTESERSAAAQYNTKRASTGTLHSLKQLMHILPSAHNTSFHQLLRMQTDIQPPEPRALYLLGLSRGQQGMPVRASEGTQMKTKITLRSKMSYQPPVQTQTHASLLVLVLAQRAPCPSFPSLTHVFLQSRTDTLVLALAKEELLLFAVCYCARLRVCVAILDSLAASVQFQRLATWSAARQRRQTHSVNLLANSLAGIRSIRLPG